MLHLLPDQHQPAAVPEQDLDAVGALAAIHDDSAGEWIRGQHFLRQRSQTMGALAIMWCTA